MRQSFRAVLVLVVVLLALTSCSQSQTRSVVLGTFVGIGGQAARPGHIPVHPSAGRIVGRGLNGQSFAATAGSNGHFRMLLLPGVYLFTGYPAGSHVGCSKRRLNVRAGERAVRIELACALV
jgi:hypothetical protein